MNNELPLPAYFLPNPGKPAQSQKNPQESAAVVAHSRRLFITIRLLIQKSLDLFLGHSGFAPLFHQAFPQKLFAFRSALATGAAESAGFIMKALFALVCLCAHLLVGAEIAQFDNCFLYLRNRRCLLKCHKFFLRFRIDQMEPILHRLILSDIVYFLHRLLYRTFFTKAMPSPDWEKKFTTNGA